MRIALFGGTFDPVHIGHLGAARAAARLLRLDKVLFVPSAFPPHKLRHRLTSYEHRFGMVTLACAGEGGFVPSLLESPSSDGQPQYSVSTAGRVKRRLAPADRLFFLLGADAFLDLPHWKAHDRLLEMVDFIVVSRPGFSIRDIRGVIPKGLLRPLKSPKEMKSFRLRQTDLHVIEDMHVLVAARDIRKMAAAGLSLAGLVPPLVEEYIRKEGLYRPARPGIA